LRILSLAQIDYCPIAGGSLSAAIPAQIVVMAVAIVLEVRLVVPHVVGHQIVQRHAVMRRDKIDAGGRLAPVVAKQIAGAGESLGKLAEFPGVAAPECAHGIAVAVVPLGPAWREVPELVAAYPQIPRLRDQLDIGKCGLGTQRLENRGMGVEAAGVATQHRCQIEAETIDMHFLDPVLEAVDDE